MKNSLLALMTGLLLVLPGCQAAGEEEISPGTNIVTIIGAIHGQHRRSERYALPVLKDAINRFDPDVVLVELPPDRFDIAVRNFAQFGEVRESRADDFPELTDVLFPLQQQLGFTMVPVAAWTPDIANNRRQALQQIENDPARKAEWETFQDAAKAYVQTVRGKADDPRFVHSAAYDEAVRKRQQTYDRLFGDDLSAGGWEAINGAHFALVDAALDDLSGQQKRILILYGAWHKYWFLEALKDRADIRIVDAAPLFAD